jgi:TPR repeat protein
LDKKDTVAAKQWIGNSPLKLDTKVIAKEHQADKREFLIEQAANNGYMPAIRQMARRYSEAEDYKNAIYWLEKCDTLSIHDQQSLAAYYYNLKDYKKAWPLFLALERTNSTHKFSIPVLIAEFYYEGYVNVPEYEKAIKYLRQVEKVNSNENTRVFYYLGMCYLKGNGVAKDEAKGFEYMKKAVNCRSVYIKAFWEISKCYRFGRGVDQDLKKAEEYEEKAASYNNDDALWMKEQQVSLNFLEDNNPTKLQ